MISASSVIGVNQYSCPNSIIVRYNITVTCIIHHDSTADQCEVIFTADGLTIYIIGMYTVNNLI